MNFFRVLQTVTDAENAKAAAAAAAAGLNDKSSAPEVEKPKKKTKAAVKQDPVSEPAEHEDEMTDLPDESGANEEGE